MRWREFITFLGGAVTSPLALRAQQPGHVGVFMAALRRIRCHKRI